MNVKSIVKKIKEKTKQEEKFIQEKIKKAYIEIELLKNDFLKIDPDIKKIILYGSLAENRVTSINFDIDLAVKSKKYYKLVARTFESDFKIDLIDLDVIHPLIKKNILKQGKMLYEKK